MWQASVGHEDKLKNVRVEQPSDDWDTDADFVNDVTSKESRWGSKSVEGSGRDETKVNMQDLIARTAARNDEAIRNAYNSKPGFSAGYGGKFGVQSDRMDKTASGFDFGAAGQTSSPSVDAPPTSPYKEGDAR